MFFCPEVFPVVEDAGGGSEFVLQGGHAQAPHFEGPLHCQFQQLQVLLKLWMLPSFCALSVVCSNDAGARQILLTVIVQLASAGTRDLALRRTSYRTIPSLRRQGAMT